MSANPPDAGFFAAYTVKELAQGLRDGTFTAAELVREALASIDRLNPVLNAFVLVDREGAARAAAQADADFKAGTDRGPMQGIPVAVKDNIDTAGLVTTVGSAHFKTHVPKEDAECVRLLKEAGAIVIGKTLTHEFAYGPTADRSLQGAAKNPWDPSRMSGGSSGGSAVAVASGMVPLALGTDTGGSVRIPAALCGLTGFKPSYAAISASGVFPLSTTLDHVGILARSAEDAAALFPLLRDPAPQPKHKKARTSTLLTGWIPTGSFGASDTAVVTEVRQFAEALFGQAMRDVAQVAALTEVFASAIAAIQSAEAYEVHAERVAAHPELFDPEVLERLQSAGMVKGWEYVRALKQRKQLQATLAVFFERFDLLAMPTIGIVAPPLQERTLTLEGQEAPVARTLLTMTRPWNVVGLPAITIPAGQVDGLPVGLQLIAPMGWDAWLLDVAATLQARDLA
ncbi:amidase [Beijerinckia sp. L45]|uniref:amidase n=1 Tax=Beijerinckia sp. L45 TaxID=1641855 RepID=UPI00131BB129|nr:amidase [Beijerinckia sp. L45]